MPARDPAYRFIVSDSHIRHNALACVSGIDPDARPAWVVELYEYRKDRSLAQNRLYWWWLRHIADHINRTGAAQVVDEETGEVTGHTVTSDDLHDWFRTAFLDERVVRINGRIRRARKSTAKLKVAEFTAYLTQIEEHCWDRMNLVLPHPEDYNEAMGIAA